MRPRAYLGTMTATLAVLLVVHALAFFYQLGARVPISPWSRDAKIIKDYLLTSTEGRKLVLIAGSSGHFGFTSRLLAERFPFAPVNYSMHLNWPVQYYLAAIRPHLQKGDIVLLSLEYEYYVKQPAFLWQFVLYVLNFEVDYFWNLDAVSKVKFLASVPPFRIFGGVVAKIFEKQVEKNLSAAGDPIPVLPASEVLRTWLEDPLPSTPVDTYSYRLIGRYGDFGATLLQTYTRGPSYSVMKPFTYSRGVWETLAEFAHWCRDHGVSVYATWPPTIKDPRLDFDTPGVRSRVDAIVANYHKIGIPVLGDPRDFQFQPDWFGDSQYHLVREGRIERTRRVAFFLAQALESSPTLPGTAR